MPSWWVQEPYTTLYLGDKPFFYPTSRGRELGFELSFKSRPGPAGAVDTAQPAIFNVGTNWHSPWRSYAQLVSGTNASNSASYFVVLGDGSARQYETNLSTSFSEYFSQAQFTAIESNQLALTFPSGSKNIYATWVTLGTVQYCFLTRKIDMEGNATLFSYAVSTNQSTGVTNTIRLNTVTDPDGRQTTFVYTNGGYYSNLLSEVHGPGGEIARLVYNTANQLTNLTDMVGLASHVKYDSSSRVDQLITPYGTTQFKYYTGGSGWKALRVDEQGLRRHLYLEGFNGTNILSTASTEAQALHDLLVDGSLTSSVETNGLYDTRNTFYWGPRHYANLPLSIRTNLDGSTFDPSQLTTNDFKLGWTRHWLGRDASGNLITACTLSIERAPSPSSDGSIEGLLTFYDYYGKITVDLEGAMRQPRCVARRQPGEQWMITYTERNGLGNPTMIVDRSSTRVYDLALVPEWRTTTFAYAPNAIDLIQQVSSINGHNVAVVSNIFNANHQIATNHNALGEMTLYEYDSTSHKLTRITHPSDLITEYTYDASGFLSSVVDKAGSTGLRTNFYTWTNGQLRTFVDARSLTNTYVYDALGRLTTHSFPDGTGFTNIYSKLDLAASFDRMGFTNIYGYDGFRQLVRQTNANFQGTSYQYCDCGSLESVTNALGYTTSYTYDNLGRRLRVTHPDGSWTEDTYNILGQINRTTDSAGLSVTNSYDVRGLLYLRQGDHGTLLRVLYDPENHPTNTMDINGVMTAQGYDDLGRLVSREMVDIIAGNPGPIDTYQYSARGLVAHTDPLAHIARYFYDELGRKTIETNGNNEVTQFAAL